MFDCVKPGPAETLNDRPPLVIIKALVNMIVAATALMVYLRNSSDRYLEMRQDWLGMGLKSLDLGRVLTRSITIPPVVQTVSSSNFF